MGCTTGKTTRSKSAIQAQMRLCISKLDEIITSVESLSVRYVKDNALQNYSHSRPTFANIEEFINAAFLQFKNEAAQTQASITEPMKFSYEEFARKLIEIQSDARTPLLEGFIVYQNAQDTVNSILFQTLVSKLIPVQNFALKLRIPLLSYEGLSQKVEQQLAFLIKQLSLSESYKQQEKIVATKV